MRAETSATPSPESASDPVARWLWIGIFTVVIIILSLLLYILIAGVLNPPAPRTQAERKLFMLEDVVQAKPESAQAWADYANAYTATNQLGKAQDTIDRAVAQLGEGVPEIELATAKLMLARGESDDALEQLDKTIVVAVEYRDSELARMAAAGVTPPTTLIKSDVIAESAMLAAQVHAEAARWQDVVSSLDTALAEQPTNSDALVMRGYAYIELGDTDAARADFDQALVFIPEYEPALEGLRTLEEGTGQ